MSLDFTSSRVKIHYSASEISSGSLDIHSKRSDHWRHYPRSENKVNWVRVRHDNLRWNCMDRFYSLVQRDGSNLTPRTPSTPSHKGKSSFPMHIAICWSDQGGIPPWSDALVIRGRMVIGCGSIETPAISILHSVICSKISHALEKLFIYLFIYSIFFRQGSPISFATVLPRGPIRF